MSINHTLFTLLLYFGSFSFLSGQIPNDDCMGAIPLSINTDCIVFSTFGSTTDTEAECVEENNKDVWFHYTAENDGIVSLTSTVGLNDSLFNDVLSIYTGSCSDLTALQCNNADEYGFQGEKSFFNVLAGTDYYINLSGQIRNFGVDSGSVCLILATETGFPSPPNHDLCENATDLPLNQDWLPGVNESAAFENTSPDELERSRADIWYTFTPENSTTVQVETEANFSHILAIYSGDCDNLNLVKNNIAGFNLAVDDLAIGTQYFLQISGRFATLEGNYLVKINDDGTDDLPENDDCISSVLVQPDGICTPFSNNTADFSGQYPSCLLFANSDLWFEYAPENDGDFKINSNADFLHAIAVYSGECDSLIEISCTSTAACEGYLTIEDGSPDVTYFIQIMSNETGIDQVFGTGCLEILDATQSDNFVPLDLEVTLFCLSENSAELKIEAQGGKGNYIYSGNEHGEELANGSPYFVQVTDAGGCQRIVSGIVDCSMPTGDCGLFYHLEKEDIHCGAENTGIATLQVSETDDVSILWSNGETTNTIENLPAGQYSVQIISEMNGTCTHYFDIQQTPELTADTDIFLAGVNSFDAISIFPQGGTPPYSYEWETGETTPYKHYLEATNNDFIVTDANGCTFVYDVFVIDNTTNIELESQVNIYPNPTDHQFFITISNDILLESVTLYDNLGRLILKEASNQINVQAFTKGIYWVVIETDKGTVAKRLAIL